MAAKHPTFNVHRTPPDLFNWLVIVLVLAGAGYSLYVGWLALTHPVVEAVASSLTPLATALPTPKVAGGLPDLQLNQSHNRQGSQIIVDPSLIGKSNPFTSN